MRSKIRLKRWTQAALSTLICGTLVFGSTTYARATDGQPPVVNGSTAATEGDVASSPGGAATDARHSSSTEARHDSSTEAQRNPADGDGAEPGATPSLPAGEALTDPNASDDSPSQSSPNTHTSESDSRIPHGTGFRSPGRQGNADRALNEAADPNPDGDAQNVVLKVRVAEDGTADFDQEDGAGKDAGPNNGIVRVNDRVTYVLEYNAQRGVAKNATVKVVFPKGLYLTALPAFCSGPGSGLTPLDPTENVTRPLSAQSYDQLQEQTLVCNIGTVTSGSQVARIAPRVSSLVRHNEVLTLVQASAKADSVGETPAQGPMPSVKASAALNWDLSKTSMAENPGSNGLINGYSYGPSFEPCFWDKERDCFSVRYNITMSAPAGGKGVMPAIGDVTFTDDLSPRALFHGLTEDQYVALENNKDRYGARITQGWGYYAIPGGKIGKNEGGVMGTAANSVRDTGTLVFDPNHEPGTPVTMTIRGADFSLDTYPTEAIRPQKTAVPSGRAYAVSMPFTVYYPADAIREQGIDIAKGKRLDTRNTFKNLRVQGFEPTDVQTREGFELNNTLQKLLDIKPPGGLSKYFGGAIGEPLNTHRDVFAYFNGWLGDGPPGGYVHRSGEIGVAARQEVVGLMLLGAASPAYDFTGSNVLCDAWDKTKLHLKEKDWQGARYTTRSGVWTGFGRGVGSQGKAVWITGYNNVLMPGGNTTTDAIEPDQVPALTVQYAAEPAGTSADVTCGNDITWYDNPADVPGNDEAKAQQGVYTGVGRVRAYFVSPKVVGRFASLGSGYFVNVAVGYEVAENLPTGTVIPNWASMKRVIETNHTTHSMDELLTRDDVPWTTNEYEPDTHAGSPGDRLIASDAFVRVDKKVRKGNSGPFSKTPPAVTGNDVVQYEIRPSLSSASLVPNIRDTVWVEDCLPNSSAYVSAEPKPQLVALTAPDDAKITCTDGTYVRWEYPHAEANAQIAPIIMTTEVLQTAADNDYVNRVQVWAAKDTSPVAKRESAANIKVANIAGLKLAKKALTPLVQINNADNPVKEAHKWLIEATNTASPADLPISDATVIDVLPKNAEHGSAYEGDFVFTEMTPKSGDADQWTIEYTATPTAQLSTNPKDASNVPGGSTKWCDTPEGGTDGCPVTKDDVTGIRVTRPGTMPQGSTIGFEVAMTASGNNVYADYVNIVGASASTLDTVIGPLARHESTIAGSVGDRFFVDGNGNGVFDAGELPVADAVVTLSGVDDLGNPVNVSVRTGSDGSYVIPNLRASDAAGYRVSFRIPDALWNDQYEFTATSSHPTNDKVDGDSDASPRDGDPAVGDVTGVVLKPGESRVDIDAGVVKPGIDLVKSADRDVVAAGDVITYTFTATNTGSAVLHDVVLHDTAFTNGAGEQIRLDSAPVVDAQASTGSVTSLAPGQKVVWTAPYTVKAADVVLGEFITNTARVEGKSPRETPVRDEDTKRVPPFDDGAYTFFKESDPVSGSAVIPGQKIVYTVKVSQVGNLAVRDAVIEDDLAAGVLTDADFNDDAVADSGVVGFAGGKLTWRGDLAKGQVVTITYSVTAKVGTNNAITNTVTNAGNPKGACSDAPGKSCTTRHTFLPGKYTLSKSATVLGKTGTSVLSGDVITYTVRLTHTEGTKVANAKMVDDLSAVLKGADLVGDPATAVSVEPAGHPAATVNMETKSIEWMGDVLPGEALTFTYSVRVNGLSNAPLVNVVTPGDHPNGSCEDGDDKCTTSHSVPKGTYMYWKDSDPANNTVVKTGQQMTYTLNIAHASGDQVRGAIVEDDLTTLLEGGKVAYSGGARLVDGPGALETDPARPNVLIWKGDLGIGEAARVEIPVTVTASGGAVLVNKVTSPDPDTTRHECKDGDEANCTRTHTQDKGMFVYSKSASLGGKESITGAVKSGDRVDYTITITHKNGDAIPGARISDDISSIVAHAEGKALVPGSLVVTSTTKDAPAQPVVGDDKILSWTGDLAEGEVVTISYAIVVDADGSAVLRNAVTTPEGEDRGTCDPEEGKVCSTTHAVEGGTYVVSKSGVAMSGGAVKEGVSVVAGDTVEYSLRAAHRSGDRVLGAGLEDDITDVLAFADFNGDVVASSGDAQVVKRVVDGQERTVIVWSGDLGVGQVAEVRFSVTVRASGRVEALTNTVVPRPGDPRGECRDGECTVVHEVPEGRYVFAKSAARPSGSVVVSGEDIRYTVVVRHAGGTRVEGASVSDVLPEFGVYNGDAVASSGVVGPVVDGVLTWSGDLAVGQVVTVTYSVKVDAPNGGGVLVNTVRLTDPNDPKGSCEGPQETTCTTTHTVKPGEYTFNKTQDKKRIVRNGDTVTYTIEVKHKSGDRVRGAQINDDLAGVLESAQWNGDLATQAKFVKDGEETRIPAVQATFDDKTKVLNWTGDLEPYQVVTITYSVTVTSVRGAVLKNVVTAPVLPGVPKPECEVNCETENEVPQGKYVYSKTSDQPRAVKSGDKITYTLKVRHTEGDTVVGASIVDDLNARGLLDNASYNNDATLVSGPGALAPVDPANPVIAWTGDLASDEAAVVTFSVTVNAKPIPGSEVALVNTVTSEDPQLDRHGCVDGAPENCRTEHTVEPGSFVYSKSSDPVSLSMVKPGQKITYTVRVKHAGGDRVLGASVIDRLNAVLPYATYNADAVATHGVMLVDEASERLVWTGDLAIGQEATITYSVTVKDGNADTLVNTVAVPQGEGRGVCDGVCTTRHTPAPEPEPAPEPAPEPKPEPAPEPKPEPAPKQPKPHAPNSMKPRKLAMTGASGVLMTTTVLSLAGGMLLVGARRRRDG